jgi:hypothetical protein
VTSPKFGQVRVVVSLVRPCCPWFVLAPKVLQLCTNHLVWVVCRPVWVSEACQLVLIPSRSSNTPLYPLKVLWARECAPTPPPSVVLYLDSLLSPSKSWECVSFQHAKCIKHLEGPLPNFVLSRLCGTLSWHPFGGFGERTMGEMFCELRKENYFIHSNAPHAFCNLPLVRTNPQLVTPCKNIICHKFVHGWHIG